MGPRLVHWPPTKHQADPLVLAGEEIGGPDLPVRASIEPPSLRPELLLLPLRSGPDLQVAGLFAARVPELQACQRAEVQGWVSPRPVVAGEGFHEHGLPQLGQESQLWRRRTVGRPAQADVQLADPAGESFRAFGCPKLESLLRWGPMKAQVL